MRLEYFEMIDHVEEMDLDAGTIRTVATLPESSPVFDGHFPQYPILPGVMMLEIMNQTAGFLLYQRAGGERIFFLGSVRRARFRRPVKPGARVDTVARIGKDGGAFYLAEASVRIGGEMAADAEIVLIAQEFPNVGARDGVARRAAAVTYAATVQPA